ncbi:Retrovirus-related Pol polyprotein [Labeo rohita]|uniref:ribonuclease H n=1 Tax=Labeo rohita TaxID=84645 RepID=A0ABQ8L716_LABRO|nr:Retrovirus-related Pol polyprotein [Labeo rohita]
MVTILKGLHGVQNYLDDVIVYGRTAAEHDRNLQAVLTTLQHAGLMLNRAKCKFSCTCFPYLGHTITAQGLLPNVGHIQAILGAPAPTDAAKLRSFLGLTSWYSRFVPNYASEVEPMRACLRNVFFLLVTKGMGCAGMRIARWSAHLLCFNYEVSSKPGSKNVTADCLSRLPLPTCVDTDSTIEPDMVTFLSAEPRALSLEEFSKECAACPELSALRQQLLTGWPKNKKTLSPELGPFFHIRDELAAQHSLVFRGLYRLVAPVSLRGALIYLAH